MKYDTVLFDLDGTLLDTLDDLYDSVNEVLAANGYPARTRDEIRLATGNGAKHLMARSLPGDTGARELERLLAEYKPVLQKNMNRKTRPYDGIMELLQALRELRVKMAVISNKPDYAVVELCASYFPGYMDIARGDRSDLPRKPDPAAGEMVLEQLGSVKEKTIYVGDSDVDIVMGKNMGIASAGVSWGFRDVDSLREAGADHIIFHPRELTGILKG